MPTSSWVQQQEYFRRLGGELSRLADSFVSLYAPTAALDPVNDYGELLTKASDFALGLSTGISERRVIVDWRPVNREFRALSRRQQKVYDRILAAV